MSRLIFEPIVCFSRHWIFCGLTPIGNSHMNIGKSLDKFKSEMKPDTWWTPITLCKEDNSFMMDGRTGWMNKSYACWWFGMNLQTQPPLQLWNKKEEDECIKPRVRRKDQRSGKIKEAKRWHEKRMRKRRCDLGNKKLMNSSRYETSWARKTSSKREEPSWVIDPSSYGVFTL